MGAHRIMSTVNPGRPSPSTLPPHRWAANPFWIQTYTGKQFFLVDSRPEDVCIEDIAVALSRICRFGGHCREFYSVAQHSVLVSFEVPTLAALLHDAAEAYVGDNVKPFKNLVPQLSVVESEVASAIRLAFSLPQGCFDDPEIHHADSRMLATERRDLMAEPPRPWQGMAKPYPKRIKPWTEKQARDFFISGFHSLRDGDPR
jgi:hypothetical protein